MRLSTLLLLLLMQTLFVVYGLAVTFWTINEWISDERLNALFGGFMGLLLFFVAWRTLRRWARRRLGFGNGP